MIKKFVVPALVALGLLGTSLAPLAYAQKPTPAPKMGGKMDKKPTTKKSDKKSDKKPATKKHETTSTRPR